MFCCSVRKKAPSSPASFPITERSDMVLYEVPLSMSFVGFLGMGTMFSQLPYV